MCFSTLDILDLQDTIRTANSNGVIYKDDDLGGAWFDQNEVVRRLHETFSSVLMGTEDPLLEEAKRAEAYFISNGKAPNSVVRSLYNQAKYYGPSMTFTIATDEGEAIRGLLQRYRIRFFYSKSASAEMRERIFDFLHSFAIGKVEEFECDTEMGARP